MLKSFNQTQDFLYELRNAGSKFSLDRIKKLCEVLGNPQNKYPVIHVAGTNGKGSVCAMLEASLRGLGLKTGMFTSPHLVYLGERVQINRTPISADEIIALVARLKNIADNLFGLGDFSNYPSFFEFMTMLAFEKFAKEKVDCAIVEVGLGGRLDSTNIVNADICVITSIALDHTEFLGDSLEKIAQEKAGILKENVPLVCGYLPSEAMSVIAQRARELNCPFYKVEDFYESEKDLPQTSLRGAFQSRNAALARVVAKVLDESGKGVFKGLYDVSESALKNVSWAARWQEIELSSGGKLILDASHNEEGACSLEENLIAFEKANSGKKPIIAVGVLGRSRAEHLMKVVARHASEIILLKPNQPRASSFEELRECLGETNAIVRESTVGEIFKSGNKCTAVKVGETIISTGSIYLAGEVLAALSGGESDGLQDRI